MRKPLHIVFCLDNSGIGGTELNAVRTAERLVDQGHTIEVASFGRSPLVGVERYFGAAVGAHVSGDPSFDGTVSYCFGIYAWSVLSQSEAHAFTYLGFQNRHQFMKDLRSQDRNFCANRLDLRRVPEGLAIEPGFEQESELVSEVPTQ